MPRLRDRPDLLPPGRELIMRICFLGAGALGCAIGGTLTEAGCQVSLVDVNAEHVDAMNRTVLTIIDVSSERTGSA